MKRRTWLMAAALTASAFLAANATSQTFIQSWINQFMQYLNRQTLALPYAPPPEAGQWQSLSATERLTNTRSRLLPKLHGELASKQLKFGQPAFIRIFKESRELELWLKNSTGWQLFRNYPIANFSGSLGPKTREGDMQAPEGFYSVTKQQLNPASSYHLSFNIGYPNAYDLAHQRTGSLIMVHGNTVSIGCFAMTDPLIEEIYLVLEAALKNTATVPVHVFPFRMTDERLLKETTSPHLDFWQNLRPAHDLFEKDKRGPRITVENGRYQVR
ncbi:MAG: murein L,D-transpeptidase family protein [Prosthecobacter sp.]|nr:murein L,D-transpeptidase family protein [Prosthecobacter sp.]